MVIIAISLIASLSSYAQTIVKGVVLDSLTREGEPAAVVQFFRSADYDNPYAFAVTSEDGSFSKEIDANGEFELRVSNVGRKSHHVKFTLSGQPVLDMGEILIEDDVQTLKAGSVTAQKTLVVMEVDKITYKVEDDVDSKTSTVLDMLRKVPMVSVDGQDNITVNGSSSFQVYVDGKPNPMISSNPSQILKMMPASFVKSIEVVTNPGAKYDAEGVGGILNISTSVSQTGGKSISEGQYANIMMQANTKGYGGGVYYSMQKGKWAMSLNGNTSQTTIKGLNTDNERIQKHQSGEFITRYSSAADVKNPFYVGNLNLSYEIDSLNLITIGAGYVGSSPDYDSRFMTETISPIFDYSYEGDMRTTSRTNSINANLDYQHSWADNPERSLVISYLFSGTPASTDTRNVYDKTSAGALGLFDQRTDGYTHSMGHTAQADFATTLGQKPGHILNVGMKFTSRNNSSDQAVFIFDGTDFVFASERSVEYDFINNIGAVYAEYDGKFGKLGLKAGARYEHTWQNVEYQSGPGQDYDLNYGNLVPVASLQYSIGQQQNIGLSYNMRISRPGITYLNPYVDNITDPTAKSYGNPNLKSETGHNLSLVYNYFSPKWIVSMTLRQTYSGNGISQYSFFDEDYVMNTTYGNVITNSVSGLNAFVTWIPGQKTRVMFNGGGSYTNVKSEELGQRNSGWTYNALLSLQQTLPWDLRASANLIASGSTISLQGKSSGMTIGMLGLSRSFLEERLSLSLSGILPFAKGPAVNIETVSETKDFISRTNTAIPLRMLTFNISFSFGKQSNVNIKKSKRTIEKDTQLNSRSVTESVAPVMSM